MLLCLFVDFVVDIFCYRLREFLQRLSGFESDLSSLESWISNALQTTDTVNRSLQTVPPPNADELARLTQTLSVAYCYFICQTSSYKYYLESANWILVSCH